MVRVKKLTHNLQDVGINIDEFPNFHKSGSIRGMKKLYYGKDSLLVKYGNYIYNVTSQPNIYYIYAI